MRAKTLAPKPPSAPPRSAYRDERSSLFANTRLGPGLRFMDPDARLATGPGVRSVPAVFARQPNESQPTAEPPLAARQAAAFSMAERTR